MHPVRVAIIGMGGFAGAHHRTIAALEERGLARLVSTCDPRPGDFTRETREWRLDERRVRVFADYRDMLEACHAALDLVVVPTPIPLHAEMHAAAAARGLGVYLEKPPTLDHEELERMIADDDRAPRRALVGFNFIIEQPRRALKRRLLAGEFGSARVATLQALWPRPTAYFRRNPWAGRLLLEDGRVVADSCFGNAMSHHVHNLLFWAGAPGLHACTPLAAVRAELYRAHAIEGADTFFVEADTPGGVTLRLATSHACSGASSQCETIHCEHAVIRYVVGGHWEVRWNDGRIERDALGPFDALEANHLEYRRYLRGESARPATTLADCRPFVALNSLAYVSSGTIHRFPPEAVVPVRDEKEQLDYLNVPQLPAAQEQFLERGVWPGGARWGRASGEVATMPDLSRFAALVRAMAGS